MPKKTKGGKKERTRQWTVTLDDYHKFVVLKYKDVLGVKKSEAMARMIHQWVARSDIPEKAGASYDDWIAVRDTWVHEEHD